MKEIQVTFTDKNVSAWGGMKLMKDMLDSIGIKEVMNKLDLPEKGSNHAFYFQVINEPLLIGTKTSLLRFQLNF